MGAHEVYAVDRRKKAELKSVLDPQIRKRVGKHDARSLMVFVVSRYVPLLEIMIQLIRKLTPEEISLKITEFDRDICTEVFLSELKPVLPSPEQVTSTSKKTTVLILTLSQIGKLNVYRNAPMEELAELHASDRLMVKLIQIDRLGPRVEGMLYNIKFEETLKLLDDVGAPFTASIVSAVADVFGV